MHHVRLKTLIALNMKSSLPTCGTLYLEKEVPQFWRSPLPPFSFSYPEEQAASSSKMLMAIQENTFRMHHLTDDHDHHKRIKLPLCVLQDKTYLNGDFFISASPNWPQGILPTAYTTINFT
jgi:hypothetical protein